MNSNTLIQPTGAKTATLKVRSCHALVYFTDLGTSVKSGKATAGNASGVVCHP